MIIFYITLLLFAGYTILIWYYWFNWRSVPEFISNDKSCSTKVSVIIPARNEEKNIASLLQALRGQTYPQSLIEIMVINDHSEDRTVEVAKKFPGVIISDLKSTELNSYKKKAIEQGVASGSGQLIITTDSDCIPPHRWIETLVSFYETKNAAFIAAPVVLQSDSSVLQIFESLDFLVLQGITAATVHKGIHSMCNGANVAYEKKVFEEVNGFEGVDNIASGDDMLLMHKVWKKFPGRVQYLKSKDAIVPTQPMKTWKDFLNQRIRWSSKARFYNDRRIFWALLLVYLYNLSFLLLLIAGFWNWKFFVVIFLLWIAKTIVEFPFVYSVASYFNQRRLLKYFFFFQPLHIAYTIVAGWLGQFRKYEWKGRLVR